MKRTATPAPASPPVLLIEDDTATRTAMSALLAGAGYRVIASDEGRKALELAGATRPAVVLLDLATTGGMDGWEFLERRRDEPALDDVPVVVVTGTSETPGSAAAVFQKPVDPAELLRTVASLVDARR